MLTTVVLVQSTKIKDPTPPTTTTPAYAGTGNTATTYRSLTMFKSFGMFFAMLTSFFASGRNVAEALEVESENLLISAIEKRSAENKTTIAEWRKSREDK